MIAAFTDRIARAVGDLTVGTVIVVVHAALAGRDPLYGRTRNGPAAPHNGQPSATTARSHASQANATT